MTWYEKLDAKVNEWHKKSGYDELVYRLVYELLCAHDAALLEMVRVRKWQDRISSSSAGR